jgi:all-trans-8'-apo-beta-carotenal 15,15'-oxygenase
VAVAAKTGMSVPFVLHSAWTPQAVSTRDDGRARHTFADELEHLDELPDDLIAVARQVVDDLAEGAPMVGQVGSSPR